jgi:deoxyribodipyrimidine photo-lyase
VTAARSASPNPPPTVVWLRQDLRLADNPALTAAAATGAPVLPVFILEDDLPWSGGAASRWWLHHSLDRLAADLQARGLPLILRRGPAAETLPALVRQSRAKTVHWNRRYEPSSAAADSRLTAALAQAGVTVQTHAAALLCEPQALTTGQGGPYQVFTPYSRKFLGAVKVPPPLPSPESAARPASLPGTLDLAELQLLPRVDWAAGLRDAWNPGEGGASALLDRFLAGPLTGYGRQRDLPAIDGTSRLSPHLHWGEISPRQVWHGVLRRGGGPDDPFLRQIVWREFAHHLLHHFPHTTDAPLREKFAAFPWDGDPGLLPAWQQGRTGYPLVDAGMRQLWHTGWMHNRVRMVVASFLVKHLLLPWQEGARWFRDTLVDADLASNTFGWQWAAGCGADAAPYFRIFNPTAQGKRYDVQGDYIRRWVPELAKLPARLIHEPWTAPPSVLKHLGLRLGKDYPRPIIEHGFARRRALDSLKRMPSS